MCFFPTLKSLTAWIFQFWKRSLAWTVVNPILQIPKRVPIEADGDLPDMRPGTNRDRGGGLFLFEPVIQASGCEFDVLRFSRHRQQWTGWLRALHHLRQRLFQLGKEAGDTTGWREPGLVWSTSDCGSPGSDTSSESSPGPTGGDPLTRRLSGSHASPEPPGSDALALPAVVSAASRWARSALSGFARPDSEPSVSPVAPLPALSPLPGLDRLPPVPRTSFNNSQGLKCISMNFKYWSQSDGTVPCPPACIR